MPSFSTWPLGIELRPLCLQGNTVTELALTPGGTLWLFSVWPWWQRWDFHLLELTWLQLLLSAMSIAEANTEPQIWHHSPEWPVTNLTGWLHWATSFTERTMLCPYWNRHLFCYGFSFSACNDSSQTSIHGLTECLICKSRHSTQHCFWSTTSLHATEEQEWAHRQGIHWTYHVPQFQYQWLGPKGTHIMGSRTPKSRNQK